MLQAQWRLPEALSANIVPYYTPDAAIMKMIFNFITA